MSMILRYLKSSWKALTLVVFLLIIKVIADLTLPYFTAHIVNVGIQQGGLDSVTPTVISVPLFNQVKEESSATDQKLLDDIYTFRNDTFVLDSPQNDLETVFLQALSAIGMGSDGQQAPESLKRQAALDQIRQDQKELGINLNARQMRYIGTTGLAMIGISFLSVAASILVAFFASRIAADLGKRLRADVFAKTVSFHQREMNQFSTASLVTRSTNDIQQIQQSSVMILRVVIFAPLMALGGLFRVLTTNSSMTWIIGLAIIAIFSVVISMFTLAMPRFRKLQTLIDNVNRIVRETLTGLPVIRAFTAKEHEMKRFDQANEALTKTTLFVNRAMSAMMPAMMLIMNLTTVLIVYRGGINVQQGNMQVGDMMAFIQYTMLIIMSFLMLTMLTIMLPRASVSATRIKEILDTEITLHNSDTPIPFNPVESATITFHQVSFYYPKADIPALCDISFTAKQGTTTAIIGSTGSGKSTLLNLIPRFSDVSSGSIKIGEHDIRDRDIKELRSVIGYVPQQGRLFSGTIASNIAFGDRSVSEEQMASAATIAQASAFIAEKSEGLQAPISQGGGNVSGGQRQRLSIARALAGNPKILLFDDSFSALDYRTEQKLRQQLHEAVSETTVIIVAQRISSILHADTIVVLDEGRVVGQGTHQKLMQHCGVYQQIAQSQLSPQELKQYE